MTPNQKIGIVLLLIGLSMMFGPTVVADYLDIGVPPMFIFMVIMSMVFTVPGCCCMVKVFD